MVKKNAFSLKLEEKKIQIIEEFIKKFNFSSRSHYLRCALKRYEEFLKDKNPKDCIFK